VHATIQKQIDAGAEFFQTQAVYDDKVLDEFIEKAEKLDRPIQMGKVILKCYLGVLSK